MILSAKESKVRFATVDRLCTVKDKVVGLVFFTYSHLLHFREAIKQRDVHDRSV